jgi:hypothetical protein
MFTWVAVIVVCTGSSATQCSPLVFGETFGELVQCEEELARARAYAQGLVVTGICRQVKVPYTLT